MDANLLSASMRQFAVDLLKEKTYNEKTPIKENLAFVVLADNSDRVFSDFAWFDLHFPSDLIMAQWVSAYQVIASSLK